MDSLIAEQHGLKGIRKSVLLDTWAGRRYYAVEIVGQTPKKVRVRVLTPGGVMLPGRRYVNCGETVLVPKHAVVDLPKDTHKVEQGYYDGHELGQCLTVQQA